MNKHKIHPNWHFVFFILTLWTHSYDTKGTALAQNEADTTDDQEVAVKNVRIAMCQTLCIDGDREGNYARIEHALKRAAELDVQIACFPETCILGWVNPAAHQRAHPIPGSQPNHDVQRLAALARRYGLMLSVGLAEKDGEKLYDSVVLIDRDGTLLLKHRKRSILTHLMSPAYTPGMENFQVVQSRFGRIGLLVCADTFSSKHLQSLRDLRPDLVLVPYGWAAEKDQWPEHGKELANTVTKAARTIGAPVVGVDLVGAITHGPWNGRTYGGQSVTCDASGKILAVARDRDVDVVIVELALPIRCDHDKNGTSVD
jgi:predicted amidohydrolase